MYHADTLPSGWPELLDMIPLHLRCQMLHHLDWVPMLGLDQLVGFIVGQMHFHQEGLEVPCYHCQQYRGLSSNVWCAYLHP